MISQFDDDFLDEEEDLKEIPEPLVQHTDLLTEHFDTVITIVTRVNPDRTTDMFYCARGNSYANAEAARRFLESFGRGS